MAKETPVPEMCDGCARNKKMHCEVIKAPEWICVLSELTA